MAKLTLDELHELVTAYVDAEKQANEWDATLNGVDSIYGMVNKIGKQVTLDGIVVDKLPELEGDTLDLGKSIEEYFLDFILPEEYSKNADPNAYHKPSAQDPAYSYSLGRKVLKTSVPYDEVERAANTTADAANMITKITQRLYESEALYRFTKKKQVIGNMIDHALSVNALVDSTAKPVDTETSEAFIQRVKELVEDASFVSESNNLAQCLTGAAPSLTLYVKKGVIPTIQVQSLAQRFNSAELAMPVTVKVLDDFGAVEDSDPNKAAFDKTYAVLVDPRGIKLHNGYKAVRTNENGDGDFINYFLHTEDTAFISKFTYVKVFKDGE